MNYGAVQKVNDDLKKDSYNIQDIIKILPHRYPFVLIDRIIEVKPGEYVNAIKNVTINEPAVISISSEVSTDISCNGLLDGTITIGGAGGTGTLEYSIDSGITYPNTTGSFSGLSTGSYIVSVRDSNGCTTTGNTMVINEPSLIIISSETVSNATCNGANDGTIAVVASGGTGILSYSIDSGSTYTNTSGSFTGLNPGTYGIAVQDSNGCTILGSILVVNEPVAISIIAENTTDITCNGNGDGTITINASGGAGTSCQGYAGGGQVNVTNQPGGGGGGAGAAGASGTNSSSGGGQGGVGVSSTIDNSATYRGGGGSG